MIPAVMAQHPIGAVVFLDGRDAVTVRQHYPKGSSLGGYPHYVVTGPDGHPSRVSDDRLYSAPVPAPVPASVRFGATVDVRGWRIATEDERHAGSPLLVFVPFEPWAGDLWDVTDVVIDNGALFFTYQGSRCSVKHLTEGVVAAEEIEL